MIGRLHHCNFKPSNLHTLSTYDVPVNLARLCQPQLLYATPHDCRQRVVLRDLCQVEDVHVPRVEVRKDVGPRRIVQELFNWTEEL